LFFIFLTLLGPHSVFLRPENKDAYADCQDFGRHTHLLRHYVKPQDPYPFEGRENPFLDLLKNWSNTDTA
jgi:hypothetical protein